MNLSRDQLQQKVTNRDNKLKLIHSVWLCLNYVEYNPDQKSEIGIFWIDNSHFMINTYIFGLFVKKKPNTINRNFRSHGFCYKKTTFEMRESVNECLPDSKNWILRWADGFTKLTTESEAISWKYTEIVVKNPRKIPTEKGQIDGQTEEKCHPFLQKETFNFEFPSNVDLSEMFTPPPPPSECFWKIDNDDKANDMDFVLDIGNVLQQNETDYFSLF